MPPIPNARDPIDRVGPIEVDRLNSIANQLETSLESSNAPSIALTKVQQVVYDAALNLGDAFFSGALNELRIRPRLFPLIAGPTGSGKTRLCAELAARLNAHHLHVTFGDWMPRGVRESSGNPTTFTILDLLSKHERVVLHIDELDKCREDFNSAWSRSVASDIWNTLDLIFPIADYIKAQNKPRIAAQAQDLERATRTRLWIVGSGTWQEVFNSTDRPSVGFGNAGATKAPSDADMTARIRAAKHIPEELLARFASDLLVLRYPQTLAEKEQILEDTGLADLGRKLGMPLDPAMLTFEGAGMRTLESIATRLVVESRRRSRTIKAPTPKVEILGNAPSPTLSAKAPRLQILTNPDTAQTAAFLERAGSATQDDRIIRFRLHLGKAHCGWAEAYVQDPAFTGIDAWCRRFGLPPFPSPVMSDASRYALSHDPYAPKLLTSAAQFYAAIVHTHRRNRERLSLLEEFQKECLPYLNDIDIDSSKEADTYLTQKAISSPPPPDTVLNGAELARQVRYHLHAGAMIATRWIREHRDREADDPQFLADALGDRIRSLWRWAIRVADHLDEWPGVVETVFRPSSLDDSVIYEPGDESTEPPAWQVLNAATRIQLENAFHTESRGATRTN